MYDARVEKGAVLVAMGAETEFRPTDAASGQWMNVVFAREYEIVARIHRVAALQAMEAAPSWGLVAGEDILVKMFAVVGKAGMQDLDVKPEPRSVLMCKWVLDLN